MKYFYKISQKDTDGLESKKDDYVVMGSTLPKPYAPTFEDAKFDGSAINLRWFKVDPRSTGYIVERVAKTGWFEKKSKRYKTMKRSFVDHDLAPNTTYTYRVYAIDSNGIISEGSQEVTIEVKELRMKKSNYPQKSVHIKQQNVKTLQPTKTIEEQITPIGDLEVDSE